MAEETPFGQWKRFLESKPPNSPVFLPGLLSLGSLVLAMAGKTGATANRFNPGEIDLHCGKCGGSRTFATGPEIQIGEPRTYKLIEYRCCNCRKATKIFAVLFERKKEGDVEAMKLGEFPPFSSPISPQIKKLFTDRADLELYRSGVRAMDQGFGIGAAAYFRRIVESQWKLLVTKLRDAAEEMGEGDLTVFNEAIDKNEFSDAVKTLNKHIPKQLLLPSGQNPLLLLYNLLSKQVHGRTDEECMRHAQAIRTVLTAMLENISSSLKYLAEVRAAERELQDGRTSD